MADEGAGSSMNITLHPLVVINISDHFTRVRANQPAESTAPRVFGAVLGEQVGRRVELANSFEMKYTGGQDGQPVVIDMTYLRARLDQYKTTFPSYDMLGWYSTVAGVQEGDLKVHQDLGELTESLLYLTLEPTGALGDRELPINVYESEVVVVNDGPTMRFVKGSYNIDSVESERIAVDHVAHILPSGDSNSSSALAQHLGGQYTAVQMLAERVDVIRRYLQAVAAGQVPTDHTLLRQVKSLCNTLPALDTPKFRAEFLQDQNNALLVTYISAITKGIGITNEVIDKFNVAYDKHSRRRGIF